MRSPPALVLPVAVGVVAALALVGLGLLAPIEVRHSAPFGFSLTLDRDRGIAVRGGFVTPNYPDFDRIDLDLRGYDRDAEYDLTVHVRRDRPGADDLRTVPLALSGERIWHAKPTFADPFLTVRFPPIRGSAGRRYYVWVESGPRNRDDVVALWSIKSYSRARGADVLAAFLQNRSGTTAPTALRGVLVGMLLALVVGFGWLMAAVTALALRARRETAAPRPEAVASGADRWYTLSRFARQNRRRPAPPRLRPPAARPRPAASPSDRTSAPGQERD